MTVDPQTRRHQISEIKTYINLLYKLTPCESNLAALFMMQKRLELP